MYFTSVAISYHAIARWHERFYGDSNADATTTEARLTERILRGAPYGVQLTGSLCVEIDSDLGVPAYAAGRLTGSHFIVTTFLTREQMVANIGFLGIRPPDQPPKKHRNNRRSRRAAERRLRESHPWRLRADTARLNPPSRKPQKPPPDFDD